MCCIYLGRARRVAHDVANVFAKYAARVKRLVIFHAGDDGSPCAWGQLVDLEPR